MSQRLILTLGLFLIGTLHTMILAIFQIPKNFLMGHESSTFALICKLILYTIAIFVSVKHQTLCRALGLRKTLYFGLLCNFFGIATLFLNTYFSQGDGLIALVLLDMIFFGMALTSVVNVLVTYITIEFPKKVGLGIVALFAFFNLGPMIAPILVDYFQTFQDHSILYFFLMFLLLVSIWYVHANFFDAPIDPEKVHLRKGSLIWKQLHYRLALFVVAIIAYGFTESTFSLWGYTQIKGVLGASIADDAIPFFWMFLIVGQIILLIPLYFFPAKRIFYFLVVLTISVALAFPSQQHLAGFLVSLCLAGFGCSAVFPILLSQMEKELLPFIARSKLLPYIEKSISLMIAGYFIGVGLIDLWVELSAIHPVLSSAAHFRLAAGTIAFTGLISLFLDLTVPKNE